MKGHYGHHHRPEQQGSSYWESEEEASYASDLRSSSYLVLSSSANRHHHPRPPAPPPPTDSYPSPFRPGNPASDDFEPADPGMSIVSSGVYYPPPSPPPAPERDPASIKDVNYGPGHEKFPSWPMPPPAVQTGQQQQGSQRTKSWTDQSEYPKEKPKPYLRPWMVKKAPSGANPPPTPLSHVWAEPGLPDPVEYQNIPRVGNNNNKRAKAPLPPPPLVDRDGRQYGDVDYNLPSPPERDPGYHREKWREPVTEETLAKLAEMEEDGTPFLDQLRKDSLALYWTDRGGSVKDERFEILLICSTV